MIMHIEKAFCNELGVIVNIYDAKMEYFKQVEPRIRFSFFCSDEECRKKNNTRVTGVNYDKHPNENTVKIPHFRKLDNHIDTCEWVEVSEAIEELDNQILSKNLNDPQKLREIKLKTSDLIEEFEIYKIEKMLLEQLQVYIFL